jgi:hypothetical protein
MSPIEQGGVSAPPGAPGERISSSGRPPPLPLLLPFSVFAILHRRCRSRRVEEKVSLPPHSFPSLALHSLPNRLFKRGFNLIHLVVSVQSFFLSLLIFGFGRRPVPLFPRCLVLRPRDSTAYPSLPTTLTVDLFEGRTLEQGRSRSSISSFEAPRPVPNKSNHGAHLQQHARPPRAR